MCELIGRVECTLHYWYDLPLFLWCKPQKEEQVRCVLRFAGVLSLQRPVYSESNPSKLSTIRPILHLVVYLIISLIRHCLA
jgi:hypothetical protein